MKKIFAISFLSVFAVVGLARADYNGYYASGLTDVDQNYNLASVNYVEGKYDSAVEKAKRLVVTSDKKTDLAGWSNSSGYAGSDEKAPTIRYMEDSIAEAVTDVESELKAKVDVAQGEANKNAIMITNAAGNVIPAPVGDCANTTNKCALVTGVDESGNLVLQWEVIARNVVQSTAEE